MQRILVTGANGQIGSELVDTLRQRHGSKHVVGVDLTMPAQGKDGPHACVDVTDREALEALQARYGFDTVYHLASLLSAKGEQMPHLTWEVNTVGLKHVLDLAVAHQWQVFWPSSIAVFGPKTPGECTPQDTILEPTTMYGVTKRAGELLCLYYHDRFGVDVRSVRYPGLISYAVPPGGGTTDFAIGMLRAAAEEEPYACFVSPETRLPMMYMPDAVQAALDLMDAPAEQLAVRTSYNLTAFSFSAIELAEAIKTVVPGFECRYEPDFRNDIAAAWPSTIDDSVAKSDWSWNPRYSLSEMITHMLGMLKQEPLKTTP